MHKSFKSQYIANKLFEQLEQNNLQFELAWFGFCFEKCICWSEPIYYIRCCIFNYTILIIKLFQQSTAMAKRQKIIKRPNKKQNQVKSKQISAVAHKSKKQINKQTNTSKPLFKIINENEEEQDDFNALGNNPSSEEDIQQEEQQQIDQNNDQYAQEDNFDLEQDSQEEDNQENLQGQLNQEIDDAQFQHSPNNQQKIQQQGQYQAQQNDGLIKTEEDKQPVDISVVSLQIQQTIAILMNITKLGQGKPRKHYIEQLRNLLHQYYGYNFELIDHFLNFFNPAELVQFFEANQTQRPLTIRTNTLKTRRKQLAQSLIQRGVNLDPLAEWSKVGIKIYESRVPIGATPQYLAGHYMLQSASSLLPIIALDPQVGQRILDMAAAPGGKTTYIAQLMKNTGCIFANDLKKERLKALQFNVYRLGITNTVVICKDGQKLPEIFPGSFDRVLLDAPCTGLGIISKDHSIKANRLLLDIYKNSHLQKHLILAAIDCARVDGIIVYSTCSVSPLQNQQVVNYALKKRFVKIVECQFEVGEEGLAKFVEKRYHVDLRKTRRIYPHVHNMDGFYVAKLVKIAKGVRKTEGEEETGQKHKQQ